MSTELIINASLPETRIALMESGEIQELLIERAQGKGIVGNIYKGRVTRVLPGMQAAFVDIGLEKAAFLYVDDIHIHPEIWEAEEGDSSAQAAEGEESESVAGEGLVAAVVATGIITPLVGAGADEVPGAPEDEEIDEEEEDVDADEDEDEDFEGDLEDSDEEDDEDDDDHGPVGMGAGPGGNDDDGSENRAEQPTGTIAPSSTSGKKKALEASTSDEDSSGDEGDEMGGDGSSEGGAEGAEGAEGSADSARRRKHRRGRRGGRNRKRGSREGGADAPLAVAPAPALKTVIAGGGNGEGVMYEEATSGEHDSDRSALSAEHEGQQGARDAAESESDGETESNRPQALNAGAAGGNGLQQSEKPGDKKGGRPEFREPRNRDRRIKPKTSSRPPRGSVSIQDLLKEGQEVIVQVAKDPISTKGARLTCHISLPGRHLVCMPTIDHVGVSRRIERDEERRKLR